MKRFGQVLAGLGLVGVMVIPGAGAAAQDAETTELAIQSVYCPSDAGFAEAGCEPAAGVTVYVELVGGEALGSCQTEVNTIRESTVGLCFVEVPYGVDVLVTQDVATLAEGYVSGNNPQQVYVRPQAEWVPDYFPTAVFINTPAVEAPETAPPAPPEEEERVEVPEAAPVDTVVEAPVAAPAEEVVVAPVTNLPRTGSGPAADQIDVALLSAAAGVAAALGAASRRYRSEAR